MTEYLTVDGGTIAYESHSTEGPLVILAHGIGDSRHSYRFVAPSLAAAGYRVVSVDLRGCGESSTDWPAYSRTAIAGDLLALIRHLGGPATLVGHSISGGASTIAAAQAPELISGIVELAPFTRKQSVKLTDLKVTRFRKGMLRLFGASIFGSLRLWQSYLDVSYPGRRPVDWTDRLAVIETRMSEPGRMKAFQKMGQSSPADAGAQLENVRCPALIIEGTLDPDWADPHQEGAAIVAALPAGIGKVAMIEGAGHYPHDQYPDEVVALVSAFLETNARA